MKIKFQYKDHFSDSADGGDFHGDFHRGDSGTDSGTRGGNTPPPPPVPGTVPSVYRLGAENGLYLGVMLGIMFVCGACGITSPMAGLVSLAMLVAVPVVAFRMLDRSYKLYPQHRFFSASWMQGIAAFFFASLLLAVVMCVFIRFLQPGFVNNTVGLAIEAYRAMNVPEATHLADTLQTMVDKHMLPSPISMSVSMIWSVTFFGSMLSLVLAALVGTVNRKLKH